ncbi:MAG: energy transducer TonB [Gemmatimonadaceae bacterium]
MSWQPPNDSDPAGGWKGTGDEADSRPMAALRPPYRPPVGIPAREARRWPLSVSFAFHALIVLIVATPAFFAIALPLATEGAGGPGPAGGGGGGTRGSGGKPLLVERLQYVHPVPPPPPTVTPSAEALPVPPPVEEKTPAQPDIDIEIQQPKQSMDLSLAAGVGGGTGNDGTNGSGSGIGGGVGSGIGTGRGSATGPGTGGGEATIYPPAPEFTLIPPFPVPQKVKGRTVTVLFTIDEHGIVKKIELSPGTGDGKYDRRLVEQYLNATFRPATRWDGSAVAAVFPMQVALY